MTAFGKGYIVNGKFIAREDYRKLIEAGEVEKFDPKYAVGLTARERKEDLNLFETKQKAKKEQEEKAITSKEKEAADAANREKMISQAMKDHEAAKKLRDDTKAKYEESLMLAAANPAYTAIVAKRKEMHMVAIKAEIDAECRLNCLMFPSMTETFKANAEVEKDAIPSTFNEQNKDPYTVAPTTSTSL